MNEPIQEIASEDYPQKAKEGFSPLVREQQQGPGAFKAGENIPFYRVRNLISLEAEGASLRLECGTRQYMNRTCWTHETHMHQLSLSENTPEGRLNIQISFWSAHVFRIQFSEREITPPSFPLEGDGMLIGKPERDVNLSIVEAKDEWIASTGEIVLHIENNPFHLWAADVKGSVFWQQRHAETCTSDIFDMAVADNEGRKACFESFVLDGQEEIYGLGERFDHVPRTGKTVDFWNQDAIGTSNRRTYINVPFCFSTHGYGLFLNSSSRTEWEIGTLEAFTLGFSIEDHEMDYFIIHGPTPADILHRYSQLTGFAPMPPVWSFGLWMSRNSYMSWEVVHEVAKSLRDRRIPADVLHLDTAWFQEDWNCDLRFGAGRFPDPEHHLAQLLKAGFRVSLWQNNFVPPRENNVNYREGREKGYFAKDAEGNIFRFPPEITGSWVDDAIIDFSNPEATAWYAAQIERLIRQGAATIKTDFGEGIPEQAIYQNIEGRRFHNLYALVYNAAIANAIRRVSGESIVWARSGTAGSQRYPVHWGGDSQCSFAGLAGTLRAALSLGLSGFPFFSHDIGGFMGRPTPELYIRWAQFGLFSSHARCHGCGNDNSREPWTFGEEACEVFRFYADLRYRLLPYIYDQSRKCCIAAKPMVRALVIDYPDDLNVWTIQDQYLFGDSLLIAPVLRPLAESTVRKLYLPEGTWFDYWTKRRIVSRGEWCEWPVDLRTMPVFVKDGSILPYGEPRLCTNNVIGPIVELEVYSDADCRLEYEDGEKAFTAKWSSGQLNLSGLPSKPNTTVRKWPV